MNNNKNTDTDAVFHNQELNNALDALLAGYSAEGFNQVLRRLQNATLAVPGEWVNAGDTQTMMPILYQNEKGDNFYKIYTDLSQVTDEPDSVKIMSVPMAAMCKLAGNIHMEVDYLVLNPASHGILLVPAALEAMMNGTFFDPAASADAAPKRIEKKMSEKDRADQAEREMLGKLMENAQESQAPVKDPDNTALEAAITHFHKAGSQADLAALLDRIHHSTFLAPVLVSRENGMEIVVPVLLSQKNGSQIVPVYTGRKQIVVKNSHPLAAIPFAQVAETALAMHKKENKIGMVVVNPFTEPIGIPMTLLEAMVEAQKKYEEALRKPDAPANKECNDEKKLYS